MKQETRALSTASTQFSTLKQAGQGQKTVTDKKPPLGPSKMRLPLRRITNFMPPPSPVPPKKTIYTTSVHGKENITKATAGTANSRSLYQPRRISIAVRPPPPSTQVFQPRRRVSIATLRPESNSYINSPVHASASRFNNSSAAGRSSMMRDPRKARYSRLFSPLPELRTTAETTPSVMRSRKFMGSPPAQIDSSKLRHQPAIALQRKPIIWSPLKLRGMKTSRRPSLLPIRVSSTDL